jgi:nitrogenase molybdenum-cofactor synthesis protein NifE
MTTMSPFRAKAPRSREKRLDAVSAWLGDAAAAAAEFTGETVVQRIRTFSQSSSDDLLATLRLLAGIRDAVTVVHGPRGCAAAELHHYLAGTGGRWGVTNLDERDTIMGADAKLRKAVTVLYRRYRPAVIFIVATPVTAINNDDIQSVVEELHEELELPVVPVYVTGFSSKIRLSGYDAAFHALLKYLGGAAPGAVAGDTVNLLAVGEHPFDREEAGRLLAALGLTVNLLPDGATVDGFRQAAAARLSLPLNRDDADYLGARLRDGYDVPYVEAPRPVGLGATGRWLAALGAVSGRAGAASELHEREAAVTLAALKDFSLAGKRVYLSLPPATAFGVLELVEEWGGEVAGVTVTHLDRLHSARLQELTERRPNLQIHVADGQSFEEANILQRLAPDLYLGSSLNVGLLARLGIPVVSLADTGIIGYAGARNVARRVAAALRNHAFAETLSRAILPYQAGWYRRSPNWHIKQEVK